MTILLRHDFPLSLPKIVLSRPKIRDFGYRLNIGTDGHICTFDLGTTIVNPDAPGEIVEACIRKAIQILEREPSEDGSEYDAEFVAYWEGIYSPESSVDRNVISLIDEGTVDINSVIYVQFRSNIGPFHAAIYSDTENFLKFSSTLKTKGICYNENLTFYIGELNSLRPPYSLQNIQVHGLLRSLGLSEDFNNYLATGPDKPIITFSKRLPDRHLVFGWKHQSLIAKRSGSYQKRKSKNRLRSEEFIRRDACEFVHRFSPQVLTSERIKRRTALDYTSTSDNSALILGFAGLGSIGSQMLGLFPPSLWREVRLVDPDILTLENIGRHLLGIEWVGQHKVQGMRAYLNNKNPLAHIKIEDKGIVEVILNNVDFINECTAIFACTGDANAEWWIGQAQRNGQIRCPIFFVWVEPYLAGGHCIYLNGQDGVLWEDLFDDQYYQYNVIPRRIHEDRSFIYIESGCQSSYIPYDNSPLVQFLSCIFPEIVVLLGNPGHASCRFTWVGDLDAIQKLGITASQEAKALGAFQLEKASLS